MLQRHENNIDDGMPSKRSVASDLGDMYINIDNVVQLNEMMKLAVATVVDKTATMMKDSVVVALIRDHLQYFDTEPTKIKRT